jgi:hypothetical protein
MNFSTRVKVRALEPRVKKYKKWGNETQILFLLDGCSQHLNCIVSFRVMKQYGISANNIHKEMEI